MQKSGVALRKELLAEAEARVADLKRAEAKVTLAQEILMATLAVSEAERVMRIVGLQLDQLDKQRRALNAEAERPIIPNSDFSRNARIKSIAVGHEIAKLSYENDAAETELSKAQTNLTSLQGERDATPEYASYVAKKKELTESFNRMSADVTAAFSRARAVLSALEQLAGQEKVLLSSSHDNFVRLGLILANTLRPSSQLELRCSELRAKFQRDLD